VITHDEAARLAQEVCIVADELRAAYSGLNHKDAASIAAVLVQIHHRDQCGARTVRETHHPARLPE